MAKVAVYCRLSDEDRNKLKASDDSESIQNQKNLLVKYSLERGWDIYRIYSDDDYSGLDADRPEFNQMLKDAEDKKFDIILCKNQARFTRDMELVEKYLHKRFIEWGIRFVGYSDNCDTDNMGNKKQRQIIGLTNEWYCEEISENIKTILNLKRSKGQFIGSFASYGYMKDPNNKNRLVVDENAARVVRMIFNLYLEGYGAQHIACILNEKGIPNPAKYKKETGLNYKNTSKIDDQGLWNKTTVKRILKNEIYVGNMVQGKRRKLNYKSKKVIAAPETEWIKVLDTHEAIIKKSLFDEAKRRMDLRQRSTGEGKAHMLATKVICADCGSTMNKVTAYGEGGVYSYLRCRMHTTGTGKKMCTSCSIRLDALQSLIISKLKSYFAAYLDDVRVLYKLQAETMPDEKVKHLKVELKNTDYWILNNSKVMKSLYIDKVNGIINHDQFLELNKGILLEKDGLKRRRENIEKQLNELNEKSYNTYKWTEIIRKYLDMEALENIPLGDFVDFIEVGKRDKTTGKQRVSIHWLF